MHFISVKSVRSVRFAYHEKPNCLHQRTFRPNRVWIIWIWIIWIYELSASVASKQIRNSNVRYNSMFFHKKNTENLTEEKPAITVDAL